jgi:phosphohistidine phosphatase
MSARSLLRLTLVRHAKTEPARPGQEDWDRVLEPRGQRDAPEMARRLKQISPKVDRVLSSPAVRAITTATIMTRELGVSAQKVQQDERLYLASPKDMLAVIRELGERSRHLMVVGHNPGMTEFADKISSERGIDNMPTCAVYTLQFEIGAWSELEWDSGVDAELDYPKRSG